MKLREFIHLFKCQYEARCSAEAITFLPLAVDTFGGWHKVGLKTITRLGRQLARNLGKDEDEVVRHLRQRLGVLIVRHNAVFKILHCRRQ